LSRIASRRRYGSFPTTADVGIWARGSTAAQLFEGLGLALFARMTDLRQVRPREERTVTASGPDPPALAVAYLTQLLNLQQADSFIGRSIRARPVGSPPTSVLATVAGEPFDPARHKSKVEVKAVTMHRLEIDLARGRARVILDI
jgi:SHS2 domain-containing protein